LYWCLLLKPKNLSLKVVSLNFFFLTSRLHRRCCVDWVIFPIPTKPMCTIIPHNNRQKSWNYRRRLIRLRLDFFRSYDALPDVRFTVADRELWMFRIKRIFSGLSWGKISAYFSKKNCKSKKCIKLYSIICCNTSYLE